MTTHKFKPQVQSVDTASCKRIVRTKDNRWECGYLRRSTDGSEQFTRADVRNSLEAALHWLDGAAPSNAGAVAWA